MVNSVNSIDFQTEYTLYLIHSLKYPIKQEQTQYSLESQGCIFRANLATNEDPIQGCEFSNSNQKTKVVQETFYHPKYKTFISKSQIHFVN